MLKTFYKKSMDIVFVNFLWLFTSLFGILITAGAATSAMFRVLHKITSIDEPTSVFKEFVRGFKEDFWQNTLVWFIQMILFAGLYFMYISALAGGSDILLIAAIVGGYQWLIFFIYYYPISATLKTQRQIDMIKNVLFLGNKNLWINMKVIGSLAFVGILVFYVHPAFLVIAIGIYGYLVQFHLKKLLQPYYEQWKHNDLEEERI